MARKMTVRFCGSFACRNRRRPRESASALAFAALSFGVVGVRPVASCLSTLAALTLAALSFAALAFGGDGIGAALSFAALAFSGDGIGAALSFAALSLGSVVSVSTLAALTLTALSFAALAFSGDGIGAALSFAALSLGGVFTVGTRASAGQGRGNPSRAQLEGISPWRAPKRTPRGWVGLSAWRREILHPCRRVLSQGNRETKTDRGGQGF